MHSVIYAIKYKQCKLRMMYTILVVAGLTPPESRILEPRLGLSSEMSIPSPCRVEEAFHNRNLVSKVSHLHVIHVYYTPHWIGNPALRRVVSLGSHDNMKTHDKWTKCDSLVVFEHYPVKVYRPVIHIYLTYTLHMFV